MKMSNNPTKYEVLSKQYLRSILDIIEMFWKVLSVCTVNECKVLCDRSESEM